MSENQLKKLQQERDRLESELDHVKGICKVSEACAELVKYVQSVQDPFDNPSAGNPYTKKVGSGCQVL